MIKPVQLNYDSVSTIKELFSLYLEQNITAGSLHIVLDDGNISKSDIEFCINYAVEHKDYLGAYLGEILLQIPESILKENKFITDALDEALWNKI